MDDEEVKVLLVKYITGKVSDEELAFIKHWLSAHPENEQYFAQLYEAWQNALVLHHDQIDTRKAYQLFVKRVSGQKENVKNKYWAWLAVPVLAGALILAVFLFKTNTADTAPLNQLVAQAGSIRKITLTDGTIVWLNSGSTLKYDQNFGKDNRKVYLEGEGFFEIAPHKSKIPFIVNTKNFLIRDIGTKFNLKAYPADAFFETSVINGEVSIEDKAHKDSGVNRIYIKQKQVLRIWNRYAEQLKLPNGANDAPVKNYNEIQITQFTPDKEVNYTGWKDNLLIFENNTLQEITKVLERRYDVKININDAMLNSIKYSGDFKNVGSIDKVLSIIQQNTPITYTKSGNIINITKDN